MRLTIATIGMEWSRINEYTEENTNICFISDNGSIQLQKEIDKSKDLKIIFTYDFSDRIIDESKIKWILKALQTTKCLMDIGVVEIVGFRKFQFDLFKNMLTELIREHIGYGTIEIILVGSKIYIDKKKDMDMEYKNKEFNIKTNAINKMLIKHDLKLADIHSFRKMIMVMEDLFDLKIKNSLLEESS